jgi:hypothetical protein
MTKSLSRPKDTCLTCWNDIFGPGHQFADLLLCGATVDQSSEDMPRLLYTRSIEQMGSSAESGCSWCAYMLSRPERSMQCWFGDPSVWEIDIRCFNYGKPLDRQRIRVSVLGYPNTVGDYSCYTKEGESISAVCLLLSLTV